MEMRACPGEHASPSASQNFRSALPERNVVILCDITQSYTETSGGIRTYLQEKRHRLSRMPGHRHILITPGDSDRRIVDRNSVHYTVAARPLPGCAPYRFILRLDKVTRILVREKPDLVELGSAYLLPYAAWAARVLHPMALVGFYHTDYPVAYVYPFMRARFSPGLSGTARDLSQWYVRQVYNRLDMTLAPSPALALRLNRLGVRNTVPISLGVDTELFSPKNRNRHLRESLGLSAETVLWIYSGRLDEEKRIPLLLEAFQLAADSARQAQRAPMALLIIGEGPMKSRVLSATEARPDIFFLPYQTDRRALAGCLAGADAYVTAGPHETFGLSVIEAQASGLGILGVNAGALRERITAGTGYRVQPDSVDALACGFLSMDRQTARLMGSKSRRLVISRYSWDITLKELFETYETLIARTGAGKRTFLLRSEPRLGETIS